GKSTLISLLARLHDPPPGTVFVDGVDVREIPLAVLRSAIGFVPQEPFLFSDTLADNVAFGLDAQNARLKPSENARLKPSRYDEGGTSTRDMNTDERSAPPSAERDADR